MLRESYPYLLLKWFRARWFPSKSQRLDRLHDPSRIKFYSQFIQSGDLVFDVGANIGNRTNIFLQLNARVVAVEPQPSCYRMLKLRFGKKITLLTQALGATQGEATMFVSNSPELSSLSSEWISAVKDGRFINNTWQRQLKIKVNTLDHLIGTFGLPKFCKIDVEGFEEEVLRGLTSAIPVISFEYTWPERAASVKKCFQILDRLGEYQCNFTVGEDMKLQLSNWVTADQIMKTQNQREGESLFGDIYVKFKDK